MFEIVPLEDEPQSDPRLMTPIQLREYSKRGGFAAIAGITRGILVAGNGNAEVWPQPLRQRGLSCQTMALINGIRCRQAAAGVRMWEPNPAEVERIRIATAQRAGESSEEAASNARYLRSQGLLGFADEMQQPITAAETMVKNGFAVMTEGTAWHATTIIPNLPELRTPDGDVPELISIDSLTGQQAGVSAEAFCSSILELDWTQDELLVCTVGAAALSR